MRLQAPCALALALLGLAGCSPTPIKIKIACTATSDCASAMIATYDGIFAKHGLDAEMTLIGINTNIPPAIVSDSIQIGGPTSTVFLQAVDGGLDLVAIAGASVMDPVDRRPHRRRAAQGPDDEQARRFRRQEGRRARHRRLSRTCCSANG